MRDNLPLPFQETKIRQEIIAAEIVTTSGHGRKIREHRHYVWDPTALHRFLHKLGIDFSGERLRKALEAIQESDLSTKGG